MEHFTSLILLNLYPHLFKCPIVPGQQTILIYHLIPVVTNLDKLNGLHIIIMFIPTFLFPWAFRETESVPYGMAGKFSISTLLSLDHYWVSFTKLADLIFLPVIYYIWQSSPLSVHLCQSSLIFHLPWC